MHNIAYGTTAALTAAAIAAGLLQAPVLLLFALRHADPAVIGEVLLHTAVYAGVPNSNRAFALGKQALADLEP